MPSFTNSKDMIGITTFKTKLGHVTLTTSIREQFVILRLTLDIFYKYIQNFTTLASIIPEACMQLPKFKMDHVT